MNEVIKGARAVAQRIVNAEKNFIECVMANGFTKEEAEKVLRTYRKAKVIKVDPVLGRITVKHGVYWEKDVLRNAVRA